MILNDVTNVKYACSTIHFQKTLKNWTSGNNVIDKFMQNAQLSTHGVFNS
jgi:hypothetical protein